MILYLRIITIILQYIVLYIYIMFMPLYDITIIFYNI